MGAQESSVLCVIAVIVVGLLGVEVLLVGVWLGSVTKIWCVVEKGLPGVNCRSYGIRSAGGDVVVVD